MKLPRELKHLPSIDSSSIEQAVRHCAFVAKNTVCDTHIPTGVRIYGQVAGRAILAAFDLEETK